MIEDRSEDLWLPSSSSSIPSIYSEIILLKEGVKDRLLGGEGRTLSAIRMKYLCQNLIKELVP